MSLFKVITLSPDQRISEQNTSMFNEPQDVAFAIAKERGTAITSHWDKSEEGDLDIVKLDDGSTLLIVMLELMSWRT